MEATMLAETDLGEGYFPESEVRGSYYENWGDTLSGEDKVAKYREALKLLAQCSPHARQAAAREPQE